MSHTGFVLATLAAALWIGGCGESEAEGPADAEDEVTSVLEQFFTTSNPTQCTELVTTNLLEQVSPGVRGEDELVASCEESVESSAAAGSIEIKDLSLDETDATATVTPNGGSLAGTHVTVALVKPGEWKLDRIEDLEIYDRYTYVGTISNSLAAEALGEISLPRARPVASSISSSARCRRARWSASSSRVTTNSCSTSSVCASGAAST